MASQSRNQRSRRRLPPSPKVTPWLAYQHGKNYKFQTFYNLCDPLNNKSCNKNKMISELCNRSFWQKNSYQGWVIVICDDDDTETKENYGNCYIWNPASLEIIMLPNVLRSLHQESFFESHYPKDCVLSFGGAEDSSCSHSCSSDNYDDWMVYILLNDAKNVKSDILLYCHPGEKEWRKHKFVGAASNTLRSMLYFNGKVFVMFSEENVHLEVEILHHGPDKEEKLSVSDFILVKDNFERQSVAGWLECRRPEQSWMESFGEFFRIERYYIPRGVYQSCLTQIIISKLNFDSMAWEKVKGLDDYVLFLSEYQQLSCLASELGFSRGCVYYTQYMDMGVYKYTSEDESILLSLPCPDISSPWLAGDWLMINATGRVDDRRTADLVLNKDEYIAYVAKDGEKEDIGEVSSCLMLLYDDVLRLISDYLHPVDYLHLRAVSKNYRSLINLKRSFSTRTLQTAEASPWLVFPDCYQTVYKFVNPMHNNESYLMNISESFEGYRIRFSKGGWLLMSKGETMFFYNPFTRSTIKLPDLSDNRCLNFSGISFSSLPTSSDCVVFGTGQRVWSDASDVFTFFIKRGDDCWTSDSFTCSYLPPDGKVTKFEADFNSPVFYRGAFYCLDNNGALGVSTIENGISWEILANVTRPNREFIYKTFLVECEGKLLSVLLGHSGKWVRVFRLNDADRNWVEVKHLGRHMLFISNTSCISAVAPTGQMENKIYFPRLHNGGILYFSLDTRMFHCVGSSHSAKDYRDSKENLHCSWIEPNWSETPDDFRNWSNM